jgi:protein-tyrosine phosphatase
MRMLDLSWITDHLAIGGHIPPAHFAQLARDRVSVVVDLRGEACDDERLLARHQIELLHLPAIEFAALSPATLQRGVAFVIARLRDGRRVLVHCSRGIGRSAMLALCVLVECGHAPIDALALTKRRRGCVSPSRVQFEAWATWLATHRAASGATWSIPTFEEFKAIAYPPTQGKRGSGIIGERRTFR